MKYLYTILCGMGLLASSASALELTLTPGGLVSKYADLINTKDDIVVLSGEADVRDLALLKDMSSTVRSLDMSDLKISAYSYPSGESYMGRSSFETGELPPYLLIGSQINKIALPKQVQKIGESAFVSSMIESIDFPESLKEIANYAFANADNLRTATLKNNVKLGIGVFKDCDRLKNVVIEYDISEIPDAMFDGCFSFDGSIPTSVKSIGSWAYRGTNMLTVDLTNVTKVGDYSFADMKNLSTIITNSNHDLDLGTGAFFNDGALELIPTLTTDMQQAVFSHTRGTLGNLIDSKYIGAGAYANNTSIDSIYFGANVQYIGSHAFRNNTSLKLVDVSRLKDKVIDVEPDAFSGLENDEGNYKHIDLNVENGTAEEWQKNPVWALFNIGNFDVGVDDIVSDASVDINIRKIGNSIEVNSSQPIDYVGVFSLNGIALHESKPGVLSYSVPELYDNDVIIVKVISSGISKIVKLK